MVVECGMVRSLSAHPGLLTDRCTTFIQRIDRDVLMGAWNLVAHLPVMRGHFLP